MLRRLVGTLPFLLIGCGGGSRVVPRVATLEFVTPATDTVASRGARIFVDLVADEPLGVAAVEIFADGDGDAGTTVDQYPIAASVDDDGIGQQHVWEATGAPFGTYFIMASMGGLLATAPGRVTLSDLAFATVLEGLGSPPLQGFTGGAAATFPDGSFAIGGRFRGMAVFGEGEANETVFDSPATPVGFIARYASDGTLMWARLAGWEVQAITAFPDGSAAVCGTFLGIATFGAGEPNETTLLGGGTYAAPVFVARYGPDGALDWAQRLVDVEAVRMAAGPQGCTFLAGAFTNTLLLGEGQVNETLLIAAAPDSNDIFVACVEPDGDLAWARREGDVGTERVGGIAAFRDGSCAVVGDFNHVLAGLASHGRRDAFVLRLSPTGALLAATRMGGVNDAQGLGIAPHPDGTCTVFGVFDLDMRAGAFPLTGDTDRTPFVAVVAVDGSVRSARRIGNRVPLPAEGTGYFVDPWLGAASPDGSVVVCGSFTGSLTLGEGEANETTLTAESDYPYRIAVSEFFAVFEPNGTLRWARSIPQGSALLGSRAALGADGSVVFAMFAGGAFALGATAIDADPDAPYSLLIGRFNADGDF